LLVIQVEIQYQNWLITSADDTITLSEFPR